MKSNKYYAVRSIMSTNLSNRQIADAVGLSHTTINRLKKRVQQADLDWEAVSKMSNSELEQHLAFNHKDQNNKRVPDWDYLFAESLKKHVTVQLLWEEYYAADPATAYGRTQFSKLFKKHMDKKGVSYRHEHTPGELVFVDFAGKRPYIRDSKTGAKTYVELFVAVIGGSQYIFCYAVRSQDLPSWIEANVAMMEFYGGVPQGIVPDNLKAAVTRAGKDPVINAVYQEFAEHYDCVIIPARPRKPKDKGIVENTVKIVYHRVLGTLRNREFFSIEELNEAIAEVLEELNQRPLKDYDESRKARFERLDKPALKPLPAKPYVYAKWVSGQKVPKDYHVRVQKHRYSVPYQLVGDKVRARIRGATVEIYHDGLCVATHPYSKQAGGMTTTPEHCPKEHRFYMQQTPENMLAWAKSVGYATTAFVEQQFAQHRGTVRAMRACISLKRLCKQYGKERIESACQHARDLGSVNVTMLRIILRRNEDLLDPNKPTHGNTSAFGLLLQKLKPNQPGE